MKKALIIAGLLLLTQANNSEASMYRGKNHLVTVVPQDKKLFIIVSGIRDNKRGTQPVLADRDGREEWIGNPDEETKAKFRKIAQDQKNKFKKENE